MNKTFGRAVIYLFMVGTAYGGTINIDTWLNPIQPGSENQGWHALEIGNSALNDNYFTGFDSSGPEYRSWFAFDLTGVSGTILAMTFEVRRYIQSVPVTLNIWDVTTPTVSLPINQGGVAWPDVFNDLGSGVSYGSFAVPEPPVVVDGSFDILSFELNAFAVEAANAAKNFVTITNAGYFAIGASVTGGGAIFVASNDESGENLGYTQRLVLTTVQSVPDGGSCLALLGGALAGIAALRRKLTACQGDIVS